MAFLKGSESVQVFLSFVYLYIAFGDPITKGLGLGLGCLMPLSTIFQLYRGGQFYW